MADISFIVFKDAQGYYRLEGEGDAQKRVDMSEEEAEAWIAAQSAKAEAQKLCFCENCQRDREQF